MLLLASEALAGLPRPEDVAALRTQLSTSRAALKQADVDGLDPADRELLSAQLSAAEDALKRFVALENKQAKKNRLPPLYALAGTLAADDVTGVGAADDVLLPIVGLAILVTHFAAMNAPTTAEVEGAWAEVVTRVEALSRTATEASARRKKGCSCVCYGRGKGPTPLRRMATPRACGKECKEEGFDGYKCGGPVIWN